MIISELNSRALQTLINDGYEPSTDELLRLAVQLLRQIESLERDIEAIRSRLSFSGEAVTHQSPGFRRHDK